MSDEKPDLSWWTEGEVDLKVRKELDLQLADIDALPKRDRKSKVDHVVRCAGCGARVVEVVPLVLPNGLGVKVVRFWRMNQRPLKIDAPADAVAEDRAAAVARAMADRQSSYRRGSLNYTIVADGLPPNPRALISAACHCRPSPYVLRLARILGEETKESVVGLPEVQDGSEEDVEPR